MAPLFELSASTLQRIALELRDIQQIAARMRERSQRPGVSPASDLPSTPMQEMVAGVWCELLGLDQAGIHDNFFRVGGHSLIGTRLLSRLSGLFSVDLALSVLFENPTVAGLCAAIESARRGGTSVEHLPLERVPRGVSHPLSFAQERLWFLDQLEGESAAYNMPFGFHIVGALDTVLLERTLQAIVNRHEALRSSIHTGAHGPEQRIHNEVTFRVPVVSLDDVPEALRPAESMRLAREEAKRLFPLSQAPLIRMVLYRLESGAHLLLLNVHHVVFDGWSLGILLREIAAVYAAFEQGRPFPLPDLPVQYVDYVAWQRRWLTAGVLDRQLSYWKSQLAGAPPLLDMTPFRPRPGVQTFRGETLRSQFPRTLSEELKTLSQSCGVTLFMTLAAGYAALLERYSGQKDIVIASPIANRRRPEFEAIIGFFVNTLALRVRFDQPLTVRELLEQVRSVTLGAYDHQDVPFAKLVEALQPERSLRHGPIVQVNFVFLNTPPAGSEFSGLTVEPIGVDNQTARFDLTLTIEDTPQGLKSEWEYNADLYDGETIARFVKHYESLLTQMARRPGELVARLPVLSPAERKQLLFDWNATEAPFPENKCLHELIEEQVDRTPDAVALEFEGRRLTFREMNAQANQLASHLRSLGVGPDSLVGVCAERSLELPVALLGILKAGGAYVPFDPEYPPERLAFMMEDAQTPVILTQQHLRERLPQNQAKVVLLDGDWAAIAQSPGCNAPSAARPENLAYVIFTSGSTGKPKGVMVPHRGIVNRLVWMQNEYRLVSDDTILQKTPFSFDVSVWEFFWPMLTGARLVLARPGGHRDPGYVASLIEQSGVTTLHFVPSMLAEFLAQAPLKKCSSVRRVICSGEALPPELVARFFERWGCELHNLYGPTEASVDVTAWQCSPDDRLIPIGRPIANTQTYVLDEYLEPVPIGVAGELYLGGVQLARGYLNRPDLTESKFIPNPFGPGRLYRTGDVALIRSDAAIEYLGRTDHQVKLRGFRIELGEIETVLSSHPSIRETVVLVREDIPGDRRLVAYVVKDGDADPASLRQFLKGRLPEYMVPAAFVEVQRFALSANGKFDRAALPAPTTASIGITTGYVAPRTPTEESLAEVWAQVLSADRIGVFDNFFDLGGHSLLGTQLISRVNAKLAVPLTIAVVFECPTVAAMGERVEHLRWIRNNEAADAPGELLEEAF